MLRKVFLSLIFITLLLLDMEVVLAQQQQPPLVPPQIIYGTARIGDNPLDRFDTQENVSIRLVRLLIIFLDSADSQGFITQIIGELENGNTASLRQAFLNSDYCQSRQPPIELSPSAVVLGEPDGQPDNEWRVKSGVDTYTVLSQQIKVWNGGWVNGVKLEVYQHNGLLYKYNMGTLATDNYVLEAPISPNNILWGNNSYILRDPGKAMVGDEARIYISGRLVTVPAMPYIIGQDAFVQMDIKAPFYEVWKTTLQPGWSLISYGINVCFYYGTPPTDQPDWVEKVDVATLGFDSLASWVSNVITPNQAWKMIIGKNGSMDRSLNPIFHTLTYLSPIDSYWISIDESAEIELKGLYYRPGIDKIPLKEDWNFVGYPMMVGYYDTQTQPPVSLPEGAIWIPVPPPVAKHVFSNIENKYSMVIGQNGTYNSALPPAFSSLHYMAPGQGFLIKMNEEEDLVYPSQ